MSMVTKFTVKRAEISVAIILALCSAALMMKSAENRITWSAEENMGAGFLPFYLSLGMLICCFLTIIKGLFSFMDTTAAIATAPSSGAAILSYVDGSGKS